jgi:hypothetical protein
MNMVFRSEAARYWDSENTCFEFSLQFSPFTALLLAALALTIYVSCNNFISFYGSHTVMYYTY